MAVAKALEYEQESLEEGDFQEAPPSDIVAYNELRSCADLFRMYASGFLDITPDFQREVVWSAPAQTRFIDSLIKQLPIPSLCFSYGYKTEEWQVIDGLQRISSIIKFLDPDSNWVLSALQDIDPRISGRPVSEFVTGNLELNKLRRRVENATLPVTVLRCDPTDEKHSNYLFTIFHRLNTGGTKLNNQEVRNCIFSGPFNDLLKKLDDSPEWLHLNGLKKRTNDRFRRQEIILRYFALKNGFENYTEGLARFLNNYMRENRKLSAQKIRAREHEFNKLVDTIHNKIGDQISQEKPNLTLFEALLVGVGRNIANLEKETPAKFKKRYEALKAHDEFSDGKLLEGLSKTVRVVGRLKASEKIFG